MKYKLTNKKDRMFNLGTKEGKMLNFGSSKSRVISEWLYNVFSSEIERAVYGGFLKLEKIGQEVEKSKEPKKPDTTNYDLDGDGDFDADDKSLAGKVLQKKFPKKKISKKSTGKKKSTRKKSTTK